MREAGGNTQGFEVTLRRLSVPLFSERECAVEELLSRADANIDQLCSGEAPQCAPSFLKAGEVLANHARVDGAQRGLDFARAMIAQAKLLKTGIGAAEADGREVRKIHYNKNLTRPRPASYPARRAVMAVTSERLMTKTPVVA